MNEGQCLRMNKNERLIVCREGTSNNSHLYTFTRSTNKIYTDNSVYTYMYLIYGLSIGFVVMTPFFIPFVVSLDCISSIALVSWSARPMPSFKEWL